MFNSTLNASRARTCVFALLLAMPLSACMVGPDYRRPEVEVPAACAIAMAAVARRYFIMSLSLSF